jgi:hypothetical protein
MASLRAVLPSLQASGWRSFNENREQQRQRPHLSLAVKSTFNETRALHVSKRPFQAERCNEVRPLKKRWDGWKCWTQDETMFWYKNLKTFRAHIRWVFRIHVGFRKNEEFADCRMAMIGRLMQWSRTTEKRWDGWKCW